MKVLVTGADGFIGSHLTEMLVKQGHDVKALSLYNSFNDWGWLEDTECINDIEVISGDVRDPYFCQKITKGAEVVYHLAALIAIPYSYIAPDSYVDTNINGTLNMCQAALNNDVSRIIHTSTSEVYGTAQYVPIDEKHPLQPQSPYSATKIGADAIAMSFYNSFDLPLTTARPFNTYGPRQSARAVIPSFIIQLANDKNIAKVGDTSPTRDFNYVEDTCRGFIALAEEKSTIGKTINIGSNYEITVSDVMKKIADFMGKSIELETDQQRIRPEKSEVFRLWCDNSEIKKHTNFEPKNSIDDGLKKTIEWFTNDRNLQKYKANIYNV